MECVDSSHEGKVDYILGGINSVSLSIEVFLHYRVAEFPAPSKYPFFPGELLSFKAGKII